MIKYKTPFLNVILCLIFVSCKQHSSNRISKNNFIHNNISRDYIYYAPKNLKKNAPLVVVLHGFTSSAQNIMEYTKFNKIAKENNFAVVYPQGSLDQKSRTFWNVGYDFHSDIKTDDVDFIIKLTEHLQEEYSLNTNNTFLTGMSNGGEMCYLLMCQFTETFKAVAPVSGTMLQSFFNNCNTQKTVPILTVFGTNDSVTNYEGDLKNNDGWGAYLDIPSIIKFWADSKKYTSIKIDTLPNLSKEDGSFIITENYSNSTNNNELVYYKVINGGHDWPGAWGNKDIILSEKIWSFFEKHKQ